MSTESLSSLALSLWSPILSVR